MSRTLPTNMIAIVLSLEVAEGGPEQQRIL